MTTRSQGASRHRLTASAACVATMLSASAALAAPQPKFLTPGQPAVLPNVLYVLPYAVSDHTGLAQQAGSGVSAETIVSIGLPFPPPGPCQVQVQWVEFNGVIAGYSGPRNIVGGATLEFTTAINPAVIITPFNQNVFSNLEDPFEGHARIRSNCLATSRLRVDAKYVTDFFVAGSTAPSTRVKRHEIKVVRPAGNVGD